ncbi:PP2C family protein-serine/threonine phosphatase [Streptomyces aidingensis]|nr:PP2C family serine/threonine-protein phosphatase [Streptomyces aidingensis]
MTLALRFAAGSHTGLIRDHNEDSGYAGPRLLAVADGMGGQAAGEVASSEVISTLVQLDDDIPGSDVLTSLGASAQHANARLRAMVEEDPQLDGMGTTLTALLWTGQRLGLVHIGDSRAYLLRDGMLTQITQDHTWVQRLVDEGRITEEEATTHPQRSLLMRALGSADHVEADLSIREVRAGDRYLICSDGLSGVVSHETLEHTLGGFQPPQDTIRELIELALRGGGPDNITCIVADVVDTGYGEYGEGDTLATRLHDNPQIVGAVAEVQGPQVTGQHPLTPAARAAELRAQQPPAPPPAPAPGNDGDGADEGVLGNFGAYHDQPYPQRRRRRWLGRSLLILLALALLGAGGYAGYRWTQNQYYIGVEGDHVAIYRGLSQDLGPLSLREVHTSHDEIELGLLAPFKQNDLKKTISVDSLRQAEQKVAELREEVACVLAARLQERQEAEQGEEAPAGDLQQESPPQNEQQPGTDQTEETEETGQPAQDDGNGTGSEEPAARDLPALTKEQEELAAECPTAAE